MQMVHTCQMQNKNNCFSFKFIVCLLILFLAGSLSFAAKKKNGKQQKMPEWVIAPSNVFPEDKYFAAVGNGSDRDSAEVRAVNSLASIFNQSVKTETKSSKRMSQAQIDGKVAIASIEDFNQKILKKVDVDDLIGIEIKEVWFDTKENWYAVAVMDKDAAARIIVDMIKKNSSAVEDLLRGAESSEPSIEKFATLDFACDIAIEDESLLQRLMIINPDKAEDARTLCQSPNKVAAKRFDVAKSIPMFVDFQGDVNGRIENTYLEEISKFGFMSSQNKNARYVLTALISFEESETTDKKSTRCRYNIDSFILDRKTGNQLLPFKASGREGHVSYDEAKERAIKSMEKKIRGGFSDAMKNYFRNFIGQ